MTEYNISVGILHAGEPAHIQEVSIASVPEPDLAREIVLAPQRETAASFKAGQLIIARGPAEEYAFNATPYCVGVVRKGGKKPTVTLLSWDNVRPTAAQWKAFGYKASERWYFWANNTDSTRLAQVAVRAGVGAVTVRRMLAEVIRGTLRTMKGLPEPERDLALLHLDEIDAMWRDGDWGRAHDVTSAIQMQVGFSEKYEDRRCVWLSLWLFVDVAIGARAASFGYAEGSNARHVVLLCAMALALQEQATPFRSGGSYSIAVHDHMVDAPLRPTERCIREFAVRIRWLVPEAELLLCLLQGGAKLVVAPSGN